MKELHDWCVEHKDQVSVLKTSFEANRPWRDQRTPSMDARQLMSASDEINRSLRTLRYVRSKKNLLKDLAGVMVGSATTAEEQVYGPAPSFDGGVGTGVGAGAVAGLAGDIVSGWSALRDQHRALKKELKKIESASDQQKKKMSVDYYNLISRFAGLVVLAAESEAQAVSVYKSGFNVPIANEAWRVAQTYNWLVQAA